MKLKYWLLIAASGCAIGAIWIDELLFACIFLLIFAAIEWAKSKSKQFFPWETEDNNNKSEENGKTTNV